MPTNSSTNKKLGIPRGTKLVESMNELNKQSSKVEDYLDKFQPRMPYNKPENPILGPILFPNGATYYGQINTKYQIREGEGTQIWEDGSIYTGQWFDDRRHGEGDKSMLTETSTKANGKGTRQTGKGSISTLMGRLTKESSKTIAKKVEALRLGLMGVFTKVNSRKV